MLKSKSLAKVEKREKDARHFEFMNHAKRLPGDFFLVFMATLPEQNEGTKERLCVYFLSIYDSTLL